MQNQREYPVVTRRGLLVAGLGAISAAALVGPSASSATRAVSVGILRFQPFAGLTPMEPQGSVGREWQWVGLRGDPASPVAAVAARGDLPTGSAQEALSLVLAAAAAGSLPRLRTGTGFSRTVAGARDALRLPFSFTSARGADLHGVLMTAAAAKGETSAVVVALGQSSLGAADIDAVLDSAVLVARA